MFEGLFDKNSTKQTEKQKTTNGKNMFEGLFDKKKDEVVQTKDKTGVMKLPGGGALNVGKEGTDELINTGHTSYGGVLTKKGYERADIVPVSLGGSNQTAENIVYEPYSTSEKIRDKFSAMIGKGYIPQTKTDKYLKNEILPQYKAGKISLNEARVKAVVFLQNELEGIKQGVAGNFISALKEIIPTPSNMESDIKSLINRVMKSEKREL